jgi:primosomal protein N' (replication factor Y)
VVRVPLGGRKTRGYIVELAGDRPGRLKDLSAVSGAAPVFDKDLLKGLQWAADHYVAPVSILLDRSAPPNLPRVVEGPPGGEITARLTDHPLTSISQMAAEGNRRPVAAIVAGRNAQDWLWSLAPVLSAGRSALVIAATTAEVEALAGPARAAYGDHVASVAGETASEVTRAWEAAQGPGRLIIGTPRVATWLTAGLALVVVVEEGRRAMKDRQTPTIHVRDLMTTRSRLEGFGLAFIGPTPSLEVIAAGGEVTRVGARAWPLVEVVDRTQDPPGAGFLSERTISALRAVTQAGRRSFVFTHVRAADASMRCTGCRRVRRCEQCGSRLGRTEACGRCGAPVGACIHCGSVRFEEMGSVPERLSGEINRRIGHGTSGVHPSELSVSVGTERDLAGLGRMGLVVAADTDSLMLGHNYRAGEEALRILARLANTLEAGSGRRMMVQTSLPASDLVVALRRGDPIPYLEALLSERAQLGLPPASEIIAVELRGEGSTGEADSRIRSLGAETVLGPAKMPDRIRWLLQGALGPVRFGLRPLVQSWREQGWTVRVDADPIDL